MDHKSLNIKLSLGVRNGVGNFEVKLDRFHTPEPVGDAR
jgi:hypothetical protein